MQKVVKMGSVATLDADFVVWMALDWEMKACIFHNYLNALVMFLLDMRYTKRSYVPAESLNISVHGVLNHS